MYGKHAKNLMKTDVKDTETGYEVDIDLPGFKKDEITMKLENGTLTVSATKGLDKDEENKEKKYVRRERYAGGMSRSSGYHFHISDGYPLHQRARLHRSFCSFRLHNARVLHIFSLCSLHLYRRLMPGAGFFVDRMLGCVFLKRNARYRAFRQR